MPVMALMVDVDGVLVDGRPADGRHWNTSLLEDLGVSSEALHEHFFKPYWENIVLGRRGLVQDLTTALEEIAPHIAPDELISYWFERDSRVDVDALADLAFVRSAGVRVYLATNQEHRRARYLMDVLGLRNHVDGIYYSADLGARKPDSQFFSRVQESVGLSGNGILLIDDSAQNVEAARRAGWQAVHWTNDRSPQLLRSVGLPV